MSAGSSGEVFGPYLVYEQLGVGGMASVHRAELAGIEGFRRPIALKRMLPHVAANADMVKSFVREAHLASYLRHSNVAQTYELGKVDSTYFIAMELITGHSLRAILRHCAATTGPMPVAVALNVLNQMCDALDYAHNLCDDAGKPLGIIHRDVSPSNIIVATDGVVKLIDFGIAKVTSAAMQTLAGTVKGKFAYMAPEYLAGSLDARADLFALGVIAHELLTNRPLFATPDDMETVKRVRKMEIPPPSQRNPQVPAEVDDIVMTALSRDPDRRWQHATALRNAMTTVTRRLGLAIGNSQVVEWIEWAFAQTRSRASQQSRTIVIDDEPSIAIEQATASIRTSPSPSLPPAPRVTPGPAPAVEPAAPPAATRSAQLAAATLSLRARPDSGAPPPGASLRGRPDAGASPSTGAQQAGASMRGRPDTGTPPSTGAQQAGASMHGRPDAGTPLSTGAQQAGASMRGRPDAGASPSTGAQQAGASMHERPSTGGPPSTGASLQKTLMMAGPSLPPAPAGTPASLPIQRPSLGALAASDSDRGEYHAALAAYERRAGLPLTDENAPTLVRAPAPRLPPLGSNAPPFRAEPPPGEPVPRRSAPELAAPELAAPEPPRRTSASSIATTITGVSPLAPRNASASGASPIVQGPAPIRGIAHPFAGRPSVPQVEVPPLPPPPPPLLPLPEPTRSTSGALTVVLVLVAAAIAAATVYFVLPLLT